MGDRRHVPALDGLRGIALVAILAYHANPRWLPGAPLSVTVFFVLSGFLITSLLVREVDTTGRVDLRAFWMRRARRLVPASILTVALVAVLVAVAGRGAPGGLLGDATAALTWSANWRFVANGDSYESLFAEPSPFQHFWTLAVEEQVYLLLPLVALVALGRHARRGRMALVVVAGIAASTWAVVTAHAANGAGGIAYYGTHVRIAEPLVGVLLALVLTRRDGFARVGRWASHAIGVAGVLAFAGLVVMLVQLSVDDPRLYRGGFLVGAVLAALVIVAATQDTPITRLLSITPLAALGTISYAVYLFHWPIFQWVDRDGTAEPRLIATEVVVTLALAVASTVLLEQPIRRRHARGAAIFTTGWLNGSVAALAAVVVAAALPIGAGGAVTAVDLGPGVDDAVPAPPVVVTVPAPETSLVATQEATVGAPGSAAPAPTAPPTTVAPVTPEEADMLTGGSRWEDNDVGAPPGGEGQIRIAVIGDSLAHNLATGLIAWANERTDVVVYDLSVSFCPLSRGGERRWEGDESFAVNERCGWWGDQWSERATNYSAFVPDVVVSAAPFSEMLDRRLPSWEDWRKPGEGPYHQWLFEEYSAMFDALHTIGSPDTRYLTMNAPCGDFDRPRGWRRVEDSNGRMVAMNRGFYPLLVGSDQGDLYSQLCPNGEYHDDLWGIADARPDGMHLSDEASAELARRWLGPLVIETATRGPGLLGG